MEDNRILYDLTEAQKRIWVTQQLYPHSVMFNIGGDVRINGRVNIQCLNEAICYFISQNSSFQIRLIQKDSTPMQYFCADECVDIPMMDFSSFDNPEEMFFLWANEEIKTEFVLYCQQLYRIQMYKINDNEYGYFIKLHHIIADGWSVKIMVNAIASIYDSIIKHEDIVYKGSDYCYYIYSDKEYIISDQYLKNKQYWSNHICQYTLNNADETCTSLTGVRKTYKLGERMTNDIKKYCSISNISINAFFVSLYYIYTSMVKDSRNRVIGVPVLGRMGRLERDTFGLFVNIIPFFYDINTDDSLYDTFNRINRLLFKHYKNQKYPFNHMIRDIRTSNVNIEKLYNICINYYGTYLSTEMGDIPVYNTEYYNGEQEYSLQIIIRDWNSSFFQIEFDYHIAVYTESQIDKMFECYCVLMQDIISADKTMLVNYLGILNKVYSGDFRITKKVHSCRRSIIAMFEERVSNNPNKVAISWENTSLSYAELKNEIDIISRFFISNYSRGTIVGVLAGYNVQTIITILGILKSGCVLLPLDERWPFKRISGILNDSDANILINTTNRMHVDEYNIKMLSFDDVMKYFDIVTEERSIYEDDLAYIMYTSGSTNKPKGVLIEHGSISNYIAWAKKTYIKSENDVFPLYTSLAFDLTMTSLFLPLVSGGQLIIYDNSEVGNVIERIINENRCTIMKLTPSHLRLLRNCNLKASDIHTLIVGGEQLNTYSAKDTSSRFENKVRIYNEYGPTEATVGCMVYLYNNELTESVPIGGPIDNVNVYILDSGMKSVCGNMCGTLYISGKCVMRGYLNQPELTAEKFVKADVSESVLYDSGDLAKYISPDIIEFVGRTDAQVKVQGFRISLSEIEYVILTNTNIKQTYVTIRHNEQGIAHIYAYYVSDNITEDVLRRYIQTLLPYYSVPSFIIRLDAIPLTCNGKIDAKSLPRDIIESCSVGKSSANNEYEELVLDALKSILNVNDIDRFANFYSIGGDSIKAIEISSVLQRKGYVLNIQDILSNPLVCDMCKCITKAIPTGLYRRMSVSESVPPPPIVRWFMENNKDWNRCFFNIVLELKQPIEIVILEQILKVVSKCHDSLRIKIDPENNTLFCRDDDYDMVHIISCEDRNSISDVYSDDIVRIFYDLENKIDVYKGILIQSSYSAICDKSYWFIAIHHIAADIVSLKILCRDIDELLNKYYSAELLSLPETAVGYKEWAMLIHDEPFRHVYLTGDKLNVGLQTNASYIYIEENSPLCEAINIAKMEHKISIEEFFLAIILFTLSSYLSETECVLEIESQGRGVIRSDINTFDTVGWFTHLYYLNIIWMKKSDIAQYIMFVREYVKKAFQNSLVNNYVNSDNKKIIRYNYMGRLDYQYKNFNVIPFMTVDNPITCYMEFNIIYIQNRLCIQIKSVNDVVEKGIMDKVLYDIKNNIYRFVDINKSTSPNHSDFMEINSNNITQDDIEQMFC